MKFLDFLVVSSTFLIPAFAYAGTELHGGDALVCFSSVSANQEAKARMARNEDPLAGDLLTQVRSAELMDIYQLRQSGLNNEDRVIESADDYLEIFAERLAILDSKSGLADSIQKMVELIPPETRWMRSDSGLREVDDSHDIFVFPADCVRIQLAVRQIDRIFFDYRLFEKLSEVSKAALLFHEYIYAVLDEESSVGTRDLVGIIFDRRFAEMPSAELARRVAKVFGYPVAGSLRPRRWVQWQSKRLPIVDDESLKLDENGKVSEAVLWAQVQLTEEVWLNDDALLKFASNGELESAFETTAVVTVVGQKIQCFGSGTREPALRFYSNGTPQTCYHSNQNFAHDVEISGSPVRYDQIDFDEKGNLARVFCATHGNDSVRLSNGASTSCKDPIEVYASAKIKEVTLDRPFKQGSKKYPIGARIEFNESGEVIGRKNK